MWAWLCSSVGLGSSRRLPDGGDRPTLFSVGVSGERLAPSPALRLRGPPAFAGPELPDSWRRARPLRRGRALALRAIGGDVLERQFPVHRIHAHAVPRVDLSREQGKRQAVGQLLLDHPAKRTGAVGRVVAEISEQLLGLVGQ